ncbi:MAG: hypothetical protein ACYTFA_09855 [Planctomycetota bacterium]
MAIRFQCASCCQPIEVDDEWASKTVACPYCRQTVTAPAESTLGDVAQMPTASPLDTGPADAVAGPRPPYPLASRDVSGNRIAVVALVLACGTVALLATGSVLFAPHSAEVIELNEALSQARDPGEMAEVWSDFLKETGGIPGWMVGGVLCVASAGTAWLASIVCAVIGMCRVRRRRLAVIALVISALVAIFHCAGGSST